MSEDSPDPLSEPQTPTKAPGALRIVAVLWLTFHAASMLHVLLPDSRIKSLIRPVFNHYQALTGTEQHWDMFSSVSNHHAYDIGVEIRQPGGAIERVGPVLPGLTEMPDYFRYHTFFTRIDGDRFAPYRNPYVEDIRGAIIDRGITGNTFEVRKAAVRIKFLESISSSGEIGFDDTALNGPYPLTEPIE